MVILIDIKLIIRVSAYEIIKEYIIITYKMIIDNENIISTNN